MGEIIRIISDSDATKEYEVDLEEWTCSCPHFQYRLKEANIKYGSKKSCKHIDMAVLDKEAKGERPPWAKPQ